MPIYEWNCPKCENSFELLQKMNASEAKCPDCGQETTQRLLSGTIIDLIGGGYYKPGTSYIKPSGEKLK